MGTRRRAAAAIRRLGAPVALLAVIAASVSGAWADPPSDGPNSDRPAAHEPQAPDEHGASGANATPDGSAGEASGDAPGDESQSSDSGDSQPPDGAPADGGDQSDTGTQPDSGDQSDSGSGPDTGTQPPPDAGDTGQPDSGAPSSAQPKDGAPGRYIVIYRDSVGDVDRATREREKADGFKARHRYKKAVKGFAAKLSSRQVEKLEADPAIDFVTPDRRVTASDSVPLAGGEQAPPTGVRRIQAASTTSAHEASGVGVAVIDSGIDLGHPDLNASNGKNCRSDNAGAQAQDDNGHGTHVAGIIAARNNGAGLVGVAPGTKLYAVKVLDASGTGSWSDVICGIEWVTDHAAALDIKVANLSLGSSGPVVEGCATTQDALHQAICNSTDAGVTYVAAAGNAGKAFDARGSPSIPAAYPQVLAVTAMSDSDGLPGGAGGAPACRRSEYDDKRASFSDYAATSGGSQHTIAAPGVCITSTLPDDGYATKSGTSMAAPHVAGVVALCLDDGGTGGPCAGKSPADVIQQVRSEAKSHTDADHRYGFKRDPDNDPASGKYFGYLAWVGVSGSGPPTSAGATLAPTSVAAVKGTIVSGGAGRLAAEDGRFLAVQGGTEAVSWYGQFTGVPTGVSSLAIDYKGHESADCPQQLSVYDWSSNAYVTADTRSVGTADVKVSVGDSQLPGSAGDYVSPKGAVRVLVSCTGKKVTSSGDLMSLAYQAP